MARKILTRDQAETAKNRAASFIRNVPQDDDRADEVEDEGTDEWAEETGRTITNPGKRKPPMPVASGPTKSELQDTINQIDAIVTDALDPALTREEVIQKLQEIDGLINDDEDDEDSDDSDEDDDEEIVKD